MSLSAAICIAAYNEERNIGALLDSLLSQSRPEQFARAIVIASGCTDNTCQIVEAYCRRDPRIALIAEPSRTGKVAAINRFLFGAQEDVLIVSGADMILEPDTLEHLLAPFADPEVGMVGSHPVPVDSGDTFFGYAVNLMWALHHDISLRQPKMGELIAFRNVFRRLDPKAICDELSINQLVRSAGYTTVYAPRALIHNKGPENLREFVAQRMHCIVGNLQIMHDHNISVSTMRTLPVMRAALPHALRNWKRLHWTLGAAMLELYCRVKSIAMYRSKAKAKEYQVWEPAATTKALRPTKSKN